MQQTVLLQERRPITAKINRFLASPYYILLAVLATLLCNVFALELPVYTAFVLVAVYCCFFGTDLLPLIPLVICGYLAPSVSNNPGKNPESVFTWANGGWYIAALAAILVIALAIHILLHAKSFFAPKRVLLPGILVLCGAYLLSGIFSPAYPDFGLKNLLFAALQCCSLLVPYYLVSGGVQWDKSRKDYFCWTGFGVGCLLFCELCWIYLTGDIFEDGVIRRNLIFTGWGMHNNLGGMLAMMIPFAFYLGFRYGKGWIGAVAGSVFLAGVFMTCSRSSILLGGAAYGVCCFGMLWKSPNKKASILAVVAVLAVAAVGMLLLRKQLTKLFWDLISIGMNPSYRDVTWSAGWAQFLKYPVFGGSFYPIDFEPWDFSTVKAFSTFYPPRWHNTLIQLLACTGSVGVLAYGFHRFQTAVLLLKHISREKCFIGLSVLVLLGTSMFDCHFFNIGPVLFYAMALAFAENCSSGIE